MTPDDPAVSEAADPGADLVGATDLVDLPDNSTVRRVPISADVVFLWLRRALMLASLGVPLWMVRTVSGENRFSTFDYLDMVGQIFHPDGSLRWRGFFEHQNDHMVTLPKIALAVNVWLFDGSRVTLGLFVCAVAAALAVVVIVSLRGVVTLTPWGRVIAVWSVMLFTFPIAAQHNFRIAISGSAWTLANLLMVVAVVLAVRSRSLAAGAAGVAATFTYGTGLAVWPALVVVLAVRRRLTRNDIAMLAMGVVAVLVERSLPAAAERAGAPVSRSLTTLVTNIFVTIGELFTDDAAVAMVLGVAVALVAALSMRELWPRMGDEGPAIAIGALMIPSASLVLITVSRSAFDVSMFAASRYMGVSALFALVTCVLAVLAFGDRPLVRGVIAAFGLMSLFGSAAMTARLDGQDRQIARGEVAAYMDVAQFIAPYWSFARDAVRSLDHVPFDGSFDADCGLFGSTFDEPLVEPSGKSRWRLDPSTNPDALFVAGWSEVEDLECIVVVDADDEVVGIAITGFARPADAPSVFIGGIEGVVLADAVLPVRVVARSSADGSYLDLGGVRQISDRPADADTADTDAEEG